MKKYKRKKQKAGIDCFEERTPSPFRAAAQVSPCADPPKKQCRRLRFFVASDERVSLVGFLQLDMQLTILLPATMPLSSEAANSSKSNARPCARGLDHPKGAVGFDLRLPSGIMRLDTLVSLSRRPN